MSCVGATVRAASLEPWVGRLVCQLGQTDPFPCHRLVQTKLGCSCAPASKEPEHAEVGRRLLGYPLLAADSALFFGSLASSIVTHHQPPASRISPAEMLAHGAVDMVLRGCT